MIKLSNKIISSIVGVVFAAGAITATAAVTQPKSVTTSAAPSSTAVVSSTTPLSSESASSIVPVSSAATVSSKTEASNVADGIDAIKKATDDGVSAVNKAATDAVSEVKSVKEEGKIVITDVYYAVVNPSNGAIVYHGDPDYDKYKAELGGDAGTCAPEQSKACRSAWDALKAKASTQAPTK